MTGACLTTSAAQKSGDLASPHMRNQAGKVQVVEPYEFTEPNPAASIYLSANDLRGWLRFNLGDGAYLGKRLVSGQNFNEMRMAQIPIRLEGRARVEQPFTVGMSYGLGWVIQDYRGHPVLSHAGVLDGIRAHVTLVPSARLGIAILANLHRTRMNLALSNTLIDQLLGLGLPAKDWNWNRYYQSIVAFEEKLEQEGLKEREAKRHRDTKPSLLLEAYTGPYEAPGYGTAQIVLENGALVWKWSNFRCPLDHYHFDTFIVRHDIMQDPLGVFTLGQDGSVATFRLFDVEFKKPKQ
jgi:hypothetical protein